MQFRRIAGDNIDTLVNLCEINFMPRHRDEQGFVAETYQTVNVKRVGVLLYRNQTRSVQLLGIGVIPTYQNLGVAKKLFDTFVESLPVDVLYVRAHARIGKVDELFLRKLRFTVSDHVFGDAEDMYRACVLTL